MFYFTLPDNIRQALSILSARGFDAYVVGGCVRDMLMGKTPQDYDIASSALPGELAACFCDFRVIETGLKHGTLTVVIGGENIEITTFRVDGEYRDNRRPETVSFTESVVQDLSRRDFTVNAMAYNPVRGLVDPFGGQGHLAEKKIVCVGDPDARFCEDGLRILRALRFASVLGFEIEAGTAASIGKNKPLLQHLSAERVYSEFCKLLCGQNAGEILLGFRGVLGEIIPEVFCADPASDEDFAHIVRAIEIAPPDKVTRLALLFCGADESAGAVCETVLRRLKADNKTVKAAAELVARRGADIRPDEKSVRRFAADTSVEFARRLLVLRRALAPGDAAHDKIAAELDALEAADACLTLKDLAVDGRDLMAHGVAQGKAVGRILDRLCRLVVDGEVPNERGRLLEEAARMN